MILGEGTPSLPAHTKSDFNDILTSAVPDGATFGFQGLRAVDSITVENIVPLDFLIACDYGLDGPEWDRRLRYFAVERGRNRRIVWTHSSLVEAYEGALGEQIRQYLSQGDAPRYVIPYRSTEFLGKLAEEAEGRLRILANPVEIKTRFDDKIAFRRQAVEAGFDVPPGDVAALGDLGLKHLEEFGPVMIVSERIGSSGNQTHFIDSAEALASKRDQLIEKLGVDAPVIVSTFLSGPAVGTAGLIYDGKPWMSHPSVMFTGIPGCSMHRFDYAGSDYAAYRLVSEESRRKIEEFTLKIGEWIAEAGYRGIYGVDFIVHEDEPYALELNPRVLGTTQLMTELEEIHGSAPTTTFWHLAEFLKPGAALDAHRDLPAELSRPDLSGFQLLIRNTSPSRVRIGHSLEPGIYAIQNGRPEFIRRGYRLSDVQDENEALVTCSPPAKGTIVEPRGAFCKLEGVSSIYEGGEEQISPAAREMIDVFTHRLALSPA
ncbi:MAG: ATP-grasp domain-containing protein [Nitrospinae bacterium]|nr:ATP-grasp domain-containing protein [Nitrospinota bacterium]